MDNLQMQAEKMLHHHLMERGIRSQAVLNAMMTVPREVFVPEEMVEFAYEDAPLPIGEGQTISQPYIVALMTELMELEQNDRVLEIGTGSGYAAAVLSRIVKQVYSVERHKSLAEEAQARFKRLGYDNVHVLYGDGSLGWPEQAPFDAIVATATAPEVPEALKHQLDVGGRLVIPVGSSRVQNLLRLRRVTRENFDCEEHVPVRFVPMIGEQAWHDNEFKTNGEHKNNGTAQPPRTTAGLIDKHCQPFTSVQEADISGFIDRVGDAKVVLLGESSHGTAEFYEMRARLTRELIEKKGFRIVALEADWPDASQVNKYIKGIARIHLSADTFNRYPTWMWANKEFAHFVESLRSYNVSVEGSEKVSLYGLDLYSLFKSISEVLKYLEQHDPETAQMARQRYGCLTRWQKNPAAYGAAAISGRYKDCEHEVVSMLQALLQKNVEEERQNSDGKKLFEAIQNARVVANAESYYRVMYYGSRESWNLRDQHMFETLQLVLDHHGPDAKAVVWAHNSHVGNAQATEMGVGGEKNIGMLCRQEYKDKAYIVGFGTHQGTVGATSVWDKPMEVKYIRPSHPKSYEFLCHKVRADNFFLPLRSAPDELIGALDEARLERAIGVVYQPKTELQSHYFYAVLPQQFDEYIWLDKTQAVTPLNSAPPDTPAELFPFGV